MNFPANRKVRLSGSRRKRGSLRRPLGYAILSSRAKECQSVAFMEVLFRAHVDRAQCAVLQETIDGMPAADMAGGAGDAVRRNYPVQPTLKSGSKRGDNGVS
jgi:hypothetical protein